MSVYIYVCTCVCICLYMHPGMSIPSLSVLSFIYFPISLSDQTDLKLWWETRLVSLVS